MKTLGALSAALLLLLAACSRRPGDPASTGRAYFEALHCGACHRVGASGGPGGPDLTFVGFRHTREWLDLWLKDPQAWKKDASMPNPRLSDKARAALADYLASLKGQDFPPGGAPWHSAALLTDPVERGRVIYSRAGCIACHGKAGAGGYPNNNVRGGLIPSLANAAASYTKEELKKKIRSGVKPEKADPAGPAPLVEMPPWGQVLKEDELDALAAYLFSLKPGGSAPTEW